MSDRCGVCRGALPKWYQRFSPYRWHYFGMKVCKTCGNVISNAIWDAIAQRRGEVDGTRISKENHDA